MGEQRRDGAGSGAGGAGPLQEQAIAVKEQVQQAAVGLKDQVAERATGALAGRQEAASGQLSTVAQTFRQMGDQLRDQDQADIAGYLDRATAQVERLADYLRDRDARELVGEAERFARREPALFLGGAFTLGLLAARFLKSSGRASQSPTTDWRGKADWYGQPAATVPALPSTYPGATTGLAERAAVADGDVIVGGPPLPDDSIVGGPPIDRNRG